MVIEKKMKGKPGEEFRRRDRIRLGGRNLPTAFQQTLLHVELVQRALGRVLGLLAELAGSYLVRW